MNILYCGDSNIVDGLIISILSLIKHESGDLNIYVFSMDYEDKKSVSEKAIKKLDELVKKTNKNSFVKLIDVKKYFLEEIPLRNIDTLFKIIIAPIILCRFNKKLIFIHCFI